MVEPTRIDPDAVIAIMQNRFPKEYEICIQQAYIQNLEAALRGKEESDQVNP